MQDKEGMKKMKKIMMIVSLSLVALLLVVPAFVKPAGKSNITQLDLVEKDPTEWTFVEDGAFGKMTYNTETGKFIFNGHRLDAQTSYSLINFARVDTEWPATINVLGEGTANNGGNVHIAGTYAYADLDFDSTPDSGSDQGYKIWLVLSEDIADEKLQGWTPEDILFEVELI